MKAFYVAYAKVPQLVGQLEKLSIFSIPWGHNALILEKLKDTVVELKASEFDSRDAGQMSAYLSAVDDLLKHKDDQPSIGLILCRTKDNVFVEYVLRNFNRPIGVAEFEVKLAEMLPNEWKSSLPTVEEIEAELISKVK